MYDPNYNPDEYDHNDSYDPHWSGADRHTPDNPRRCTSGNGEICTVYYELTRNEAREELEEEIREEIDDEVQTEIDCHFTTIVALKEELDEKNTQIEILKKELAENSSDNTVTKADMLKFAVQCVCETYAKEFILDEST